MRDGRLTIIAVGACLLLALSLLTCVYLCPCGGPVFGSMAGDEHEVVKVFRAMLEKTEEFAQQGQELTRRINDFDDDLKEHK